MTEPQPISSSAPPVPGSTKDDGVDVTLIRWALSLSPRERLEVLQANADALVRLQDAVQTQR